MFEEFLETYIDYIPFKLDLSQTTASLSNSEKKLVNPAEYGKAFYT